MSRHAWIDGSGGQFDVIWELVRELDGRAPEIRLQVADGDEAIEIRRMAYFDAAFGSSRPTGIVIFGDLERLRTSEQPYVAQLWHRLANANRTTRLLNNPLRAMRRYELLRILRERAINDFDAYSLLEARQPSRYPVYLLREVAENVLPLELLGGPADVTAEIGKLIALGLGRDGYLMIEFTATPDAGGCYRKYSAMGIEGRVIPGVLHISTDWRVEESDSTLDEALEAERQTYATSELNDASLCEALRLSGIDVGIVDYFVEAGRPQILGIRPGLPRWYDGPSGIAGGNGATRGSGRAGAALRALIAATAADTP